MGRDTERGHGLARFELDFYAFTARHDVYAYFYNLPLTAALEVSC